MSQIKMSQVYYNHTTKLDVVKEGLRPAATIALKRVGNSFLYGVTICSKYDNFSKKFGREIALNRLERGFRMTPIPQQALENEAKGLINEKTICLLFIYELSKSVTIKSRVWKRRITRFNKEEKTLIVPTENQELSATVSHTNPTAA